MIIECTTIELPDSLIIDGDLDFTVTDVTVLPAGLSIDGYLNLGGTPINELPLGLTVATWLDVSNTMVGELPDDITVGGYLYADDGQLIASEKVQLEWIVKNKHMLQIFEEPTEKAKKLHEMLWEL